MVSIRVTTKHMIMPLVMLVSFLWNFNLPNIVRSQTEDDCSNSTAPIIQRHSTELVWSPDSTKLAIASVGINQDDCFVGIEFQILNAINSQVIYNFSNGDVPIWGLAWNSTGDRLVSTDDDGVVKIWDMTNGHLLASYNISTYGLVEATWHLDNRVAVGGLDGIIYILNSSTGQVTQSINVDNPNTNINVPIGWLKWSYNGTKLGVARSNGTLQILDALSLNLVQTIQVNSQYPANASWSPDDSRIATNSDGNDIQIWDSQTGQRILLLQGHTGWTQATAWSPSGTLLASTSMDATIRIWNAITGQQQNVITAPSGVTETLQIDWSAAGKIAYGSSVASQNGTDPGSIPPPIITPPPTPTLTPTITLTPTRTPTATATP